MTCEVCGREAEKAATGCARGMREFAGEPAARHESECYRLGYERAAKERDAARAALQEIVDSGDASWAAHIARTALEPKK